MKNTMMLVLISFIACFLLITCQDPLTVGEGNGDGVITVTIGEGNARKMLPWANALDSTHLTHKITISDGPGTAPSPQTLHPGSTNANFSVTPGKWTITVEAYYSEELVAFARETKQITSGKNTIKIQMQPVSLPLINVTFNANGGTFAEGDTTRIQRVNKYNKAKYPEPEPTNSGKYFIDWFTELGCTNYYNFNLPVTVPFTLYAGWSDQHHTVTFVDSSGATSPDAKQVGNGGRVSDPDVKREGYTAAWYKEPAFITQWNFYEDHVTANITLYVQWTENVSPGTGTINITINASASFSDGDILHEILIDGTRKPDGIKIGDTAKHYPAAPGEHTVVVRGYDSNNKLISYADETITVTVGETASCTMKMCQAFGTSNAPDWNTAVAAINGGGNDKEYYIVVTGNFSIPGYSSNTFGNATGITVNIRGAGTITLDSSKRLLYVGYNQTVNLKDTHFVGHTNNDTSLVYVAGTFNMAGGTISGNTNTYSSGNNTYGGGVYVDLGTFNMSGGTITKNKAMKSGGGVLVNCGTFNISGNAVIKENNAQYGGGVYLITNNNDWTTTFNMAGGTITENEASFGGGGIYAMQSDGTFSDPYIIINMTEGTISGNIVTGEGGGIYMYAGNITTTFTMSGGIITGNKATGNGGGVHTQQASGNKNTFNMTGGTITNNNSGARGGGLYFFGTFNLGSLDFITNNTAVSLTPAGSKETNQVFYQGSTILINGNVPDASLKWTAGYAW